MERIDAGSVQVDPFALWLQAMEHNKHEENNRGYRWKSLMRNQARKPNVIIFLIEWKVLIAPMEGPNSLKAMAVRNGSS